MKAPRPIWFISAILFVAGLLCLAQEAPAQRALLLGVGGKATSQTITTVYNQLALLVGNDGETDVTFRQVLLTPGLSAASGATQFRITVQWGTSVSGSLLSGIYGGRAGVTLPNFDGNQVQVFWTGVGGTVSPPFASNTQFLSDWTTFGGGQTFDNTKNFMIAWGAAIGGQFKYNDASAGGTVADAYFLDFDSTQYSQTTAVGFTHDTNNHLYFVGKMEVRYHDDDAWFIGEPANDNDASAERWAA